MLLKIKSFFMKLIPTKRRLIQLYSALLYNANIRGFISGDIFQGESKSVCVPGLNCYSCPGAVGACPLGSLQNSLSESKTKYPTYVLGIILLYSIILGRTICGFLCPVGLLQELLYKIKSPKLRKSKFTRILSYLKYVILVVFVIIIPLIYAFEVISIPLPAFCKYICPAGTFEGAIFLLAHPGNNEYYGMLGPLFTWKFILLILFIVAAVFIYRFFCRFFCPLGALYGLFNKISILGIKIDKSKCNHCQACVSKCKMDIKEVGDHECIQCGDCIDVCHSHAIDWKVIRKLVKEDLEKERQQHESNDNSCYIQNNEKNNVFEKDIKKNKKDLRIKKKTFNIIIGSLMAIILVVVIVVSNFRNEVLKVNDICDSLKLDIINENIDYDIKQDKNATLLYFYDQLTEEDINLYKSYALQSVNADKKMMIFLISKNNQTNVSESVITELEALNIYFAEDTNSKANIRMFTENDAYPYLVFLDFNDKILFKENNDLDTESYDTIIYPTLLGQVVGNKVGDICINKQIKLIGSDETFSIAKNRGKITVINFWYTGCTPCVLELPHFNKLYEEYKDYMTVIAIHEANDYASDKEYVQEFIDDYFGDFSILFGADDTVSEYYKALGGIDSWPMTIIVDQDGIVSFIRHGKLSEEDLRAEINKLLNIEGGK